MYVCMCVYIYIYNRLTGNSLCFVLMYLMLKSLGVLMPYSSSICSTKYKRTLRKDVIYGQRKKRVPRIHIIFRSIVNTTDNTTTSNMLCAITSSIDNTRSHTNLHDTPI